EDGSYKTVWRHDDPASGRIGVLPRVPQGHEAWLDQARQELGPCLPAAGFSPEMCERIVAGCVCQAPAQEVPRFLLGKDGQRLAVLHPSGVLQEMRLDEWLHKPPAAQMEGPAGQMGAITPGDGLAREQAAMVR